MPWLASQFTPTTPLNPTDVPIGGTGTLRWLTPAATSLAGTHEIQQPANLHAVNQQTSWASDGNAAYNCGGYNDNAVVTGNWQLWPLSIRAPNRTPDVSLTAGPGITAEVVCYLRWFDELSGERSPLSAGVSLSAVNQSITYANLDDQHNPERATHIEGWESRDGSLPRLVFRRQIGVITVVHAKALGDLGEVETSNWTKPPRCRFGLFWHDRYVMAGDDQSPTTIYFMAIGFPERWEGFTLDMKSGQAIVGMTEINGRLLVCGATVTEGVGGWTEDDLRIDIVQPDQGLISHFSIVKTDTYAWLLTQEQPFLTDGVSWFPMGKDIKYTYALDFKNNRKAFQQMFVDHHPDEHLVRWYLGPGDNLRDYQSVSGTPGAGFVFLVADYEPVLPLEGGSLEQPRWSYDFVLGGRACAALMGVPGGKRKDPFTGGIVNGSIFKDSGRAYDSLDDQTLFGRDEDPDGDATYDNIMEILTGALQFDQFGGPDSHGLRITDLTMLWDQGGTIFDDNDEPEKTKHDLPWTVRLYAGDIKCASAPFKEPGGANSEATAQDVHAWIYTAPASNNPVLEDPDTGEFYRLQPVNTHHFGEIPSVVGRAFKLRLTMKNPQQATLSGFIALWMPDVKATREHGKRWTEE